MAKKKNDWEGVVVFTSEVIYCAECGMAYSRYKRGTKLLLHLDGVCKNSGKLVERPTLTLPTASE